MNSLVIGFLMMGLADAQFVQPVWFDRVRAQAEASGVENVRRCFKREDVPPEQGFRCGPRSKTCYFGTQSCPGDLLHPITKCQCPGIPNRQWDCLPAQCPDGGLAQAPIAVPSQKDATLESNNIDIYPGYTGNLEPVGTVKVKFLEDDSMLFSYDMAGLPANCIECGVHINIGVTCESPDEVFGPYWDPSEKLEDPWTPASGASYSTNAEGESNGFFHMFSGFNFTQNIGHAIVFVDQKNVRIGCGTLSIRDMTLQSDLDIYPDYIGNLETVGSVRVSFHQNDAMLFSYDMVGLPRNCIECGVQIRTGVSCVADNQVLDNYWDVSNLAEDPWTPDAGVSYSSNAKGEGKGFFYLETGFNFTENIGHAVVFQDENGVIIACGTLSTTETIVEGNDLNISPGYTGNLEPRGRVKSSVLEDDTVLLSYDVVGLPSNCIECGVSIHSGVTCEAEDFLDASGPNPDTVYSTDVEGEGKGFFHTSTRLNYTENLGHAVVFHDQEGAPVGCGTLW